LKRLTSLCVLFAALLSVAPGQQIFAQQPTVQVAQDPQSTTVYITKTGKKYHKDGCRYLAASKIKTTLKDQGERIHAVQGLPSASIGHCAGVVPSTSISIVRL
jgi:hypothetical protein